MQGGSGGRGPGGLQLKLGGGRSWRVLGMALEGGYWLCHRGMFPRIRDGFLIAKGLSCGHECVLDSSAFWEGFITLSLMLWAPKKEVVREKPVV